MDLRIADVVGMRRRPDDELDPHATRRPKRRLALALATTIVGCGGAEEFLPASIAVGPDDVAWHSPEGGLWNVSDVLEKDGAIWTLSSVEPFVRGLRSGEEAVAFGVRGEGPGELRSARALLPLGGAGRIAVWDAAARLHRTYSSDGEPISEAPARPVGTVRGDIDAVTFGDPLRVAVTPDGFVVKAEFPGSVTWGPDLWTATLTRSGAGVEDEAVVDFRDLRGASGDLLQSSIFLVPVPLWDVCPDGPLAVLDPISRFLHLVESSWAERDSLFVPWEPEPVGRSDRISYPTGWIDAELRRETIDVDDKRALVARAEEETRGRFSPLAPIAVDLRCGAGRVWMQEYDGGARTPGYGRTWRTVSLADRRAPRYAEVRLVPGFRIHRVSDTRLLGVATDDLGLQRVASVPVPLSLRPDRGNP